MARQWTRMKRETFLREQLAECLEDVERFRENPKATIALMQARRLALEIRRELDELADAQKRPEEEKLSDDELAAILIDAVRHLPEERLDEVEEELYRRRGPSLSG